MSLPDSSAPDHAWLELADGRRHWLTGPCALGRQPENDLVLDSPTLSRRHALIAPDAFGFTLTDLHSRNGTFVNGLAIARPTPLRHGDELRLGDVVLHFRCARRLEETSLNSPPPTHAATVRLDQLQERACWLLLLDIAGSSSLNHEVGSTAAHRRIQDWIAGVQPLIENHRGRIAGYLGDAIYAHWVADVAPASAVLDALRAIEAWRPASPLAFRIVLHHGHAVLAHSDRGEEVTGRDAIFLFRSEKLAKTFNTSVLLSEPAVASLGLAGTAPLLGHSPIDGVPGHFAFFGLPPKLAPQA